MGSLSDSIYQDERDAAARSQQSHHESQLYLDFLNRKNEIIELLGTISLMPASLVTIGEIYFIAEKPDSRTLGNKAEMDFYDEGRLNQLREIASRQTT
jgi:hypothetical protein